VTKQAAVFRPSAAPPRRHGAGSRLIQDVLAAELDGAVEREYGSDGLQCTLCTPTRLCSSTEPQNQAQAAFDLTRQS